MKYLTRFFYIGLTILLSFKSIYSQDSLHLIDTMTGEKTGDNFYVISGVGDVNGDGYDDVLVGAPGGNYAKLYFGSSSFDTIPDIKFVCEQPDSRFGLSVAGGDFNADGFNDIVIGAPYFCTGEFPDYTWDAGKVYIYFGGLDMDSIPDLTILGHGWYYFFGQSVSCAGDVNNDGYNDLIVGAPHDDYDAHGRVYIYFGGEDMDNIEDVFMEGEDHFDMFGESVDGADDVNNDGFDDVIVGAPQDLKEEDGQAYLIYGGEDIGLDNSVIFEGDSTDIFGSFGRVVSGLGDVNNDSYDDFGIMGLDYVRIFLGNTIIDSIPNLTLIPDRNFCYICGVGDLNKDGFDDIASVSNYVNIYFGNTTLDTIPAISPAFLNAMVCGLGDINRDNYIDIGFGRGESSEPNGKVYIYSYFIGNNVEEKKDLNYIKGFRLNQNYPNPFNLSTTISYDLPFSFFTRLEIYNLEGKKIKKLVSESKKSGSYYVIWDGKDENNQVVSSGIYFVKMAVENFGLSRKQQFRAKKLLLLK